MSDYSGNEYSVKKGNSSTMSAAAVSVAEAVGEWFLQSGIQEPNGGVARYYFSDRRQNAALTTEITAYCAGALVSLYRQSGDSRYLDAAVNAGQYLLKSWNA